MKNRIIGIDLLKLFACFLVICIHSPFPGKFGDAFLVITRIAVPLFFMISGYFYNKDKIVIEIKKVIYLIIISNLIFFFFNFLLFSFKGNLFQFLSNVFSISSILNLLLFNCSYISDHLWYLNAFLYVLIFVYFFADKIRNANLIVLCIILLLCDLIFGKYSILIFNTNIPYIYVRNWLFVGLPYYFIGLMIKRFSFNINFKLCFLLSFLFIFTSFVEHFLLVYFNVNAIRDHYLSTTFLSICIFVLFNNIKIKDNIFSFLGRKYTTFIYIFHPILVTVLSYIFKNNYIIHFFLPFFILLLSIIIKYLMERIIFICHERKIY